ncbi:MAG: MBL fold metallo-hydrolase, partial [Gemmatimonadota bacterium]|nr:MBL fold metallo-hydrolase [Gemmatimonadota bacterium]
LKLTFLGTGTSFGVPVVGCRCPVCRSDDTRNRRGRHGLLLEDVAGTLLIDTPPELRLQLLAADVSHVDAVFLTHPHADHVHGIDDLRVFSAHGRSSLPVHVAAEYEMELHDRFSYFLSQDAVSGPGTTIPGVELRLFEDRERIDPAGIAMQVIGFPHGTFRSYGFRTGLLAVVVDAKRVPDDAWELLEGVETLVINALWFGKPHPTHFTIEEAVAIGERIGASRTFLTHLTHDVDHADADRRLPDGVQPAYDGLTIEV